MTETVQTRNDGHQTTAGVKTKFDVFPEQIIDYLALVGDSSDNIPGIDKVGPKTAARWLNQYGTLDALLEHREQIEGKVVAQAFKELGINRDKVDPAKA